MKKSLIIILIIGSIFLATILPVSATVTYNSAYPRIQISDSIGTNNISTTYDSLVSQYGESVVKETMLNETSPKVWEVKAYLEINKPNANSFFINNTDVEVLRLGKYYSSQSMAAFAQIENISIVNWNLTSQQESTSDFKPVIKIFENITNVTFSAFKIYWGSETSPVSFKIFEDITIKNTTQALNVYGNNLTINEITIKDGSPNGGSGMQYSYINDSTISNMDMINLSDNTNPGTGKYGLHVEGYNNILHDININRVQWSGVAIAGENWTIYNMNINNAGHNGFEMQGRDSTVENVTIRNSNQTGGNNFYIDGDDGIRFFSNITFTNIKGSNPSNENFRMGIKATNIIVQNAVFDGKGFSLIATENVTLINITHQNGQFGFKQYDWIGFYNYNNTVIDSSFSQSTYRDIWHDDGTNTRFVNTKYSSSVFNSGYYILYYYPDIHVKDEVDNSLPDTSITFENEIDSSINTVNGGGDDENTFTTSSTGCTVLPNTDRANSPAIAEYYCNSDGTYQEFSHTATITTLDDRTVTLTGITPDSSWYRADPNVPTYTITAIIPEINAAPDITGFAPAEDNPFNTGDSKIFRVWTDESLDSMNWYLDGSLVSSDSMDYTWVTTEGGHTIIFEGSNTNGDVSQRWDINGGISGVGLESSIIPTSVNKDSVLPEYWNYYEGSGSGDWGRTIDEAHTGNYSAFLQGTEYYLENSLNIGLVVGDSNGYSGLNAYDATPDTTYNVSFWIKGDFNYIDAQVTTWNTENGSGSGNVMSTSIGQVIPTDTWTQYQGTFTTPSDAKKLILMFKAYGDSTQLNLGTIYVDDVEVCASPSIVQNPSAENSYVDAPLSNSMMAITPATQTVARNQPFTLTIPLTPATNIAGAQFDLIYDNSLATVTSVTEGNLLNQSGATTLFNGGTINNAAGTVTSVYGLILGETSVSSQGSFATISMTAGSTTGYLNLDLTNVKISDADSNAAPYTLTSATVLIDTAPFLDRIGAKDVDGGSALTFTIGASDADRDSLTYSATNLPTGASLNTATGAFSWTPADGEADNYEITFEVTDGYLSDSEDVTITVNDVQSRWDVNEDKTVDVLDISIIGQEYGTSVETPYPRCDVNQDGVINVQDMVLAGSYFGETVA